MLGASMRVNADTKICVFDLLGKSAEAYKALEIYKEQAENYEKLFREQF